MANGLTTFISHSNVPDIVQRLDSMLVMNEHGELPGILLLLGLPQTGKKRVLQHWQHEARDAGVQRALTNRPAIAELKLWKPIKSSFKANVYVTPMACVLFSEMIYSLGELAGRLSTTPVTKWYRKPKTLYTDTQFTALLSEVRKETRCLGVRTFIIHNAHLLDAKAMEMLVVLREALHEHVSFILSARMQENATLDEPLAEELLRVPEAARLCTKVELERLSEEEYKHKVVRGIIEDLDLGFASDLKNKYVAKQIAPAFWQRTGYNWQHINEFVAYVRQTVPASKETGRRSVNRAMLEKLLQCSFADLEQVTPENDI